MTDTTFLGPWVRRFLLEYLVRERNLAINTRTSYRDMVVLLLPYASAHLKKPVDHLAVVDLSPELLREFLTHLEQTRCCSTVTRNQRLGGLHALARLHLATVSL